MKLLHMAREKTPLFLATHTVHVGVDPGSSNTGLVALYVPSIIANDNAPVEHALAGVEFIASTTVHPRTQKGRSAAADVATIFDGVRDFLRWTSADSCVLEEPWDNVPTRLQRQGTAFQLGRAYGLALAACAQHARSVVSYPVTTRVARPPKLSWTGWMPTYEVRLKRGGTGINTQKREITLEWLRGILRNQLQVGDTEVMSEDEIMAFGVLHYHLSKTRNITGVRPAQRAPRSDIGIRRGPRALV